MAGLFQRNFSRVDRPGSNPRDRFLTSLWSLGRIFNHYRVSYKIVVSLQSCKFVVKLELMYLILSTL